MKVLISKAPFAASTAKAGEVSDRTEGVQRVCAAQRLISKDEPFAYPLRPLRGHLPRPGGGGVLDRMGASS